MKRVTIKKAAKFFSWRYFRMAQKAMISTRVFGDERLEPRRLMVSFGVYFTYMFIQNMLDVWNDVTGAELLGQIETFAKKDVQDLLREFKLPKLSEQEIQTIFDYQFENLHKIHSEENPMLDLMLVFECGLADYDTEREVIAGIITENEEELYNIMMPVAQDTIDAVQLFDLKDGTRV